MGETWKAMKERLNKAEKGKGNNPKLTVGDYKLLIKEARLIRDEESKHESDPEKVRYQGMSVLFDVLESRGGEAIGVGVAAEKVFWIDGLEKWQRDRNFKMLRAFIETVTGEDMSDLGDDMVEELSGFVVYAQVTKGARDFPKFSWAHVPQTAEDVLANREKNA